MDDQIDEKEALEYGAWSLDYDIAEDEEERLLIEEDEIPESASHHVKEQEGYQTYEAEEAAEEEVSLEAEEDILDLDANEDVVDYEEPHNTTEGASIVITSTGNEGNATTSAQCSPSVSQRVDAQERKDSVQKKFLPYPRNPHMRRNNMQNRAQNHSIPVQMGYMAGRPRPPGFGKQIRPMDQHMQLHVGRRPLMGDPHFPPPHLNAPRHLMASRMDPHLPNFHPRMLHNPLRLPFKEQGPFGFNNPMQNDQGSHGLLGNPLYPPRNPRDVRNNLPNGPAPHPFTHMRPPFTNVDMMPKLYHRPPPPRPHEILNSNPTLPCPRFSTSLPPPPLPVNAVGMGQGPNLRLKMQAPQSLMDIVLPEPFGESHMSQPLFQERQQRFHFGSPEHRDHRTDFPPPMGPPPGACKRPPPMESSMPVVPVKQLRNDARPPQPIQRTFTNSHAEPPPLSRPGADAKILIRPTKLISPNSRRILLETPPKPGGGLLPTPTSAVVTPASSTTAVSPVTSNASNTLPAIMKIDTQGDKSAPQEMDEYMKKMEEQRKKREEVLRLKEERRRLKLAGQLPVDAADTGNQNTTPPFPGKSTMNLGEYSGNVNGNRQAGNLTLTQLKEQPIISPNEPKRTIVTAASQPTQSMPQQNADPNRRYKVIIVKNKMGQILEKRRVPIGENGDVNKAVSQVASAWSNGRVSETVEIENLNSNATEDDVRKLCQMFGPVQEVYPKLQEGKAIVRFASVNGANNFLSNHNTPGILVRYL